MSACIEDVKYLTPMIMTFLGMAVESHDKG